MSEETTIQTAQTVEQTLTQVISQLEDEQALKKAIKDATEPVEDIARQAVAELNKLHSHPPEKHSAICSQALTTVTHAHPHWATISCLIPAGEFFRISLARFILHDELIPAFGVAKLMGMSEASPLQLGADDYLQGVISMVNELPRLSINSVTAQNFSLPIKIASFVGDVYASYSLLNLRNDALRRKFDSLKWDLKRCEDVVYDLTLRGLTESATKR